MREILFRGKRLDTGEWVYWNGIGLVTTHTGKHYKAIVRRRHGETYFYHAYQLTELVDKNTIGQYTGIKDRDGKRIFEGDVVQAVYGEKVYDETLVVSMDSDRRGWFPFACGDGCGCCETDVWTPDHALVIGNVHDNPELVKGDEP